MLAQEWTPSRTSCWPTAIVTGLWPARVAFRSAYVGTGQTSGRTTDKVET